MSGGSSPVRPRPSEQIAIGLIQDAEAYRAAAVRVHPKRAPHRDVNLLAPAWHLLCHASELALKAYLLSGGADPSAKQGGLMHSTLRHNLVGLYRLALERGFNPPSEEFGELMDFLGPYHGAHVFRYREQGRMPLHPPFAIAETLEPVIAGIAQTVRERWSAAHGGRRGDEELAGVGLARAQPADGTA
ncbi:hypothetical protein MKK75_18655 [Methylobacterium sp. J-030]|uniref:hypothetical protein n=1 Tax=Methylobacterium sp. J-030 TaxID=2836627 RepID=UPI001FB92F43|nr:hypothetical protein [Methylobacterium sp. J-030]MCJ2070787.1 hypothetical protein [Methylobacterium sp. J-030]